MILLGDITGNTVREGNCIVTNWEMSFSEVLDRRMWRKTVVDAKNNKIDLSSLPRTATELGLTFASKVKEL